MWLQVLILSLFIGVEVNAYLEEEPVLGGFCNDTRLECSSNRNCFDYIYYKNCEVTCGCRDSCKDKLFKCQKSYDLCFDPHGSYCPRTCGFCNEYCSDLLNRYLCRLKDTCRRKNAQYFCTRTCGFCKEKCRNKMTSNVACKLFKERGYCKKYHPHHKIMWKICQKACSPDCSKTKPEEDNNLPNIIILD